MDLEYTIFVDFIVGHFKSILHMRFKVYTLLLYT